VSGARILVVDDEPQILRALQLKLRSAGYVVESAATAGEALVKASMRPPEAIILDVLLPDGRGTDVCRELRTWSTAPILVLSAVGEEAEKIAALDAGADDYVTKPFSGDELLARLRAALRRVRPSSSRGPIEVSDLRIDVDKRLVTMQGREISLTPIEYDLLRLLAENEGKLMTHPTILHEIWGPRIAGSRTTSTSMCRTPPSSSPILRPRYILSQPGVGYRARGSGSAVLRTSFSLGSVLERVLGPARLTLTAWPRRHPLAAFRSRAATEGCSFRSTHARSRSRRWRSPVGSLPTTGRRSRQSP
jgi:two-component system KDP operon response regulator KdpE